ncbi:MFS transporter [Terricaulis sp.]|uniref:MFS transporter n=1 Tax=Terricaulis sp. TaxID=2768686 RepID=UPI0037837595
MAQLEFASEAPAAVQPALAARVRGASWQLVLLALTIANASAMRGVFSPLQEVAESDLHFTDFQISLIQGVAASIPIAVLSLPVGRVTDRGNRAQLLFWLSALWTAGTVGTVFADGFWQLFVARMLAGVGAFCSLTVAISLTADLSAPENRGRALIFLSLGNMVGAACAFALGGALLGAYAHLPPLLPGLAPWRSVHLVFAAASVVLTLLLLALREPARREITGANAASLSVALGMLWERRALLAPLFLGQVTVVMADAAAGIWAAPVLQRVYGQTPEQFGGWMGLVILGSGLVGAILGGVSADLGQKSQVKAGILIGAVVAAALSIPGAFFPLMPDVTSFAWALFVLLTCGAITGLVTAAAIAVLVPNEIRGVCLGAFIVIGALIGFGVAPTFVTLISSAAGGIRYGLAITGVATSIAAALGFILALRNAAKPLAA